MKKTIIISTLLFIAGIVIAVRLESLLRSMVIDLFQWTTNGHIQFTGKNMYFFTTPFYYISFGLSIAVSGINARAGNAFKVLKTMAIWATVFFTGLTVICAVYANFKVMECTTCTDGIKRLDYYNDLNHGFILGICALLSGMPGLFGLVRKNKRAKAKHA